MAMTVRFWGVRGSIAVPGDETARVGGNTSCVEVRAGEARFVLDAGTGLRRLGDAWLGSGEPIEATLLLSHLHWDHIQGLPFFTPIFVPGTRLTVVGATPSDRSLREELARQMHAPNFPVEWHELRSHIAYREIRPGQTLQLDGVRIRTARLNHPGGVTGYRIEHAGRAVVYATDTEHYACVDPALVALAQDADVLVYDCMYTEEEYRGAVGPSRVGWGHSTWQAGLAAATAAGVGHFVLFHHDPRRNDDAVDRLESEARAAFRGGAVTAAREGAAIHLDAHTGVSAA